MEEDAACKPFPLFVHQIDETRMHDQLNVSIFHDDFQRTQLRLFFLIVKVDRRSENR